MPAENSNTVVQSLNQWEPFPLVSRSRAGSLPVAFTIKASELFSVPCVFVSQADEDKREAFNLKESYRK